MSLMSGIIGVYKASPYLNPCLSAPKKADS